MLSQKMESDGQLPPESYTLTQYWQTLRQDLYSLFQNISPKIEFDSLVRLSQSVFTDLKAEQHIELVGNILEKPESILVEEQELKETFEASEIYLKFHLIGMRMALEGQRLETLPAIHPFDESQKSVGNRIKSLKALFSKDELPYVVDTATFHFAKKYLNHVQKYASGGVYTDNSLVNGYLKDYIPEAQQNAVTLRGLIIKYEKSQQPTEKLQSKIIEAILDENAWLNRFEVKFFELIEQFTKIKEKPEKAQSYWGFGWFSWWFSKSESKIEEEQDSSSSVEQALTALEPILEKLRYIDKLIEKMKRDLNSYAHAAEFVWITPEAEESIDKPKSGTLLGSQIESVEKVQEEKELLGNPHEIPPLEAMVECDQLKVVLGFLHDFYETIQSQLTKGVEFDKFAMFYFLKLQEAHKNITNVFERPVTPELSTGKYTVVAKALWGEVEDPKKYMKTWVSDNKEEFTSKSTPALIFQGPSSIVEEKKKQTDKDKPMGRLKKWFSNLKI